jgi:hypothetical protein
MSWVSDKASRAKIEWFDAGLRGPPIEVVIERAIREAIEEAARRAREAWAAARGCRICREHDGLCSAHQSAEGRILAMVEDEG